MAGVRLGEANRVPFTVELDLASGGVSGRHGE
jgi:hypothetical protein